MAELMTKLWLSYNYIFDELADERTKKLFLAGRPLPLVVLLGFYLMFVLKWGPLWMKKRAPFNLEKVIMLYNAAQVVSCAYTFVNGLRLGWGWHYKWVCEPVDFSNSSRALEVAHLVYFYFILKIVDLMDTIFFILRKKFNQVTFLHVYHHTGMALLIWGAVTYYPGGHGTLVGVINSFVHVVMYSYYFLTVAFPSMKRTSWWKKYITQLQILQFLFTIIHMCSIIFKPDCAYPRWIALVFLPQNVFMLVLFIDFYINVYVRKPKAIVKPRIMEVGSNNLSRVEEDKKVNEDEATFESAMKKRKNILDLIIKDKIVLQSSDL
ncbi:unnamed protein product, partial [Iphiclides podalirius]